MECEVAETARVVIAQVRQDNAEPDQSFGPVHATYLAIPQYFLSVLTVAACAGIIVGAFAVLVTGEYPEKIRNFLVSVYRYALRVETYVGFLTDRYPPFRFAA